MKNFVQKGRSIQLVMPYDRLAGQGVLVGSIFGVCANDALSGATCSVQVSEVFDVTKDTSVFSQGDKVYWDDSAKKLSSTAASNQVVGSAVQAQLTGDATARIRLGQPVRVAAAQVDSVASTAAGIVVDFNLLLAKLRAAGLMK